MGLNDYLQQKPVLETERLCLRPLTMEDVPALREWTADPALYRWWGANMGKNDKDPARLFEKALKPTKSFHWGIVLREEGRAVGEL